MGSKKQRAEKKSNSYVQKTNISLFAITQSASAQSSLQRHLDDDFPFFRRVSQRFERSFHALQAEEGS